MICYCYISFCLDCLVQLVTFSDTKDLRAVVQRARVLMAVMEHEQVAALTATSTTLSKVDQLKTQSTSKPQCTIVITTIKSHRSDIFGKVGGISTEIMLESGSSVSLLSHDTAAQVTGAISQPLPEIWLQTASGESLPIISALLATVTSSVTYQWLPYLLSKLYLRECHCSAYSTFP